MICLYSAIGRESFFCSFIEATLLIPDSFICVTLFVPMAYSYHCFPFIQFSQTGEILLLKHASLQIREFRLYHDVKEIELYTNSFICSVDAYGGNKVLSLVDSVLLKINVWCRRQLGNYHAHYSKVCCCPYVPCLQLHVFKQTNSYCTQSTNFLMCFPVFLENVGELHIFIDNRENKTYKKREKQKPHGHTQHTTTPTDTHNALQPSETTQVPRGCQLKQDYLAAYLQPSSNKRAHQGSFSALS
jgi:hypothetical protein